MARCHTINTDKHTKRRHSPLPSPAQIRERAAEIRRSWTPEERRQREVPLPGWPLLPLLLGGRRLSAAMVTTRRESEWR